MPKEKEKSISASNIARYEACHGSFTLERGLDPALKYNAFPDKANTGSMIHHACELAINDLLTGQKAKSAASYIKAAGIDKTHADYEKAENCVKTYPKYFKKVFSGLLKQTNDTASAAIESKHEIVIKDIRCVFKADAMIVSGGKSKRIDLMDLKTGNYNYSESAGRQMFFSAAIAIAGQALSAKDEEIQVNTHVVQPNYWNSAESIVTDSFFMTRQQALDYLELIVDYVLTRDNYYTSGHHCMFCPAIVACPAQKQFSTLLQAFTAMYSGDLEGMDPETLEYLWLQKESFDVFLKAVDQRIMSLMENGTYFTRIYRKTTSGHRRWIDADVVKTRLAYLGDKLFKPQEIKSPAQVEKLAGKTNISDLYSTPEIYKLAEKETPDSDIFGGDE